MPQPDYDDQEIEERWCSQQQKIAADYLRWQNLDHGRIGEWPAWHVAPYASIWAIEGLARPDWIGWWAICGDLPTDYISAADVEPPQHPRKAMRVFAQKWLDLVKACKDGLEIENIQIGDSGSHDKLGPLLESRAALLMEWAEDDHFGKMNSAREQGGEPAPPMSPGLSSQSLGGGPVAAGVMQDHRRIAWDHGVAADSSVFETPRRFKSPRRV